MEADEFSIVSGKTFQQSCENELLSFKLCQLFADICPILCLHKLAEKLLLRLHFRKLQGFLFVDVMHP